MLNRRTFLTSAAVLPLVAHAAPVWAQAKLSVVATTSMIADAVRQVGGDLVEVRALMGPGVDPHAYRQTRADIAAMARADIVFAHGLYLEAQMEDFLNTLSDRRTVVWVGEAVPEDLRIGHEDYAGRHDPHVWMVPELWAHVVTAIREALSTAQPASAEVFAAQAEAHLAEVTALGAYTRDRLASVPEGARVLITAHDAFSYFGDEYGFEVMGILGISTESEAGLARIRELVDLIVDRKIGAVFVESSVSDRNIKALIEGAAAQGHEVQVGAQLFSDAMGAPGTYEGTYIGMIDHNVTHIARVLGGSAPDGGLNGQLALGS